MQPLFTYIWKHSRREQIIILFVVLISFPFYFYSLDIPKYIVSDAIQGRAFAGGKTEAVMFHLHFSWPSILGGGAVELFPGFSLDRPSYLFALSGVFLVLVLINGGFKYVINMRKGALGERLLQYLRFDLFSLLLRFSPEALRNVKASEAATIIKDEVEPIGGFVGDAFIQPVFLGGQAATALAFILLQSWSLGIIAGFIVFVQAAVIPRLRREQIRLGKERQLRSRALAGRIGEVVDGIGEVSNHGTSAYERQRVGGILDQLFIIRYRLFGRKFAVKFANNLLAQLTPFLFYTLGGLSALRGDIDIGQLIAVIAAYRDLPPPVKELIDWDQQRLEVEVKYQQVVEQFSAGIIAEQPQIESGQWPSLIEGLVMVQGLKVTSASDDVLLDGVHLTLPLGKHVALVERSGDGARTFSQVLASRLSQYIGTVKFNGVDLAYLPTSLHGRKIAYASPEAVIFEGTVRDNIIYSLQQRRDVMDHHGKSVGGDCLDYGLAGVDGPQALDRLIGEVLTVVGLEDAVFRFGLARKLELVGNPALVEDIINLRYQLRQRLEEKGLASLVEPFDPNIYSANSTIGENLLFGVPVDLELSDLNLLMLPFTHDVLEQTQLSEPLTLMGRKIAATMVEIFAELPADHFLFEQFSFISADQLDSYRDILGRSSESFEHFSPDDRHRLIALAFLYVEPRHRLGLLDQTLHAKILAARRFFRMNAPKKVASGIEFYDGERYCKAAPLRDNLLFGRITYGASGAAERVTAVIRDLLTDQGLDIAVLRLGLEQPCGHAGRLLFPAQRLAIGLARCLIKQPDLLIIDEGVVNAQEPEGLALLERIFKAMAGKSLVMVSRANEATNQFDMKVEFASGKIVSGAAMVEAQAKIQPAMARDTEELRALQAIPMFAEIDLARLKLLAFTSERLTYKTGDMLFRQGDPSDSAYVIVSGVADVVITTANGPITVSKVGSGTIIGEIGIITGAPRSASIRAVEEVSALCLRQDIFLNLMGEFPEMSLAVTRLIVRRLQDNIVALQGKGQ